MVEIQLCLEACLWAETFGILDDETPFLSLPQRNRR
jgi:hypothetical protein